MEIDQVLDEAEGLAAMGLFEDSWDALESLPPEVKVTRRVLGLRLTCCARLGAWELGTEIASRLLRCGCGSGHVADFFVAHAADLSRAGSFNQARAALGKAVEADEKVRLSLLDDGRFNWLFGELP
jgi:hypothetical protein